MNTSQKTTDVADNLAEQRQLRMALIVIATAQLMLVLDDSIANIALPSIQRDLGVSASTLPWIINAYVLMFGGLLLFGGRIGDLFGRRRTLQLGILIFTVSSLIGGLGINVEMLIISRGLQGLGAALTAPNALALIATTFPVGKARNKAMAVYGAMSALGITVGVLLGGFLTGVLNWRWVFFINIPIGLAVLMGTRVLAEGQRNAGKLDILDALSGAGAMIALAYGITRGGEHSWSDAGTIGAFAIALVLTALFLWLQTRRENPMMPLSLFYDRNRAGSYATVLFIGASLMGAFYLLALFMQQVLRFSPELTGLASLPFSAGIVLGAGIGSKLVERFAPRAVAAPGLVIASLGMFWLSTLEVGSSYVWHILPAVFVTYFGLGLAFVTLTLTAVHGVEEDRAGVASALVNTAQQIGAALGLSLFTTIATTAANSRLPDATRMIQQNVSGGNNDLFARALDALTYGYTSAYVGGAIMLLIAALIVFVTITTKHTQNASEHSAAL